MPLYREPVLPDGLSIQNMTAVAEYYVTIPVPQRYNAGIILASVAVSVLGSYSTLLLLGKRTSNKGARNISLLALAAATMASVGIWGMHFIGMHMTLRPIEGVTWYIRANPGFTVFSLFVPITALIGAFVFVDYQQTFSAWRVGLSGIITGSIVSLMHYSASFQSNFHVTYRTATTVTSILLGIIAATIAMVTFFRFRAQWSDSWWKRLLCASILAVGVCGMHYTALAGTSYRVQPGSVLYEESLRGGNRRNNVLTIAIAVMCLVIAVFSIGISVSDGLTRAEARRKARKVVVCSATFDKQGRLLVKNDGTLPMIVIDTDVQTRDVLDALDNRQPTFQWLFACSFDWDIVAPFLRSITARFYSQNHKDDVHSIKKLSLRANAKRALERRRSLDSNVDPQRAPNALASFRDRFIDAAGQLAVELDIPLQQIGVLFDHVLPTGTRKSAALPQNIQNPRSPPRADDESSLHAVSSIFGDCQEDDEGVMLFLVRELPGASANSDSAEKYRQRGYRMTETRFLAGVLSDRVSVQKEEMETLLAALKLYAKRGTRPVVQPGGVYAGLFGVRASTSKEGGLDVLVYNFARHQIPAYRLPDIKRITPEMRAFLRMLDQMTMEDAMRTCERESIRSGERSKYMRSLSDVSIGGGEADPEREHANIEAMIHFQTSLFIALDALHNSVRFYPRIASTAHISAEILEVPSSLDDSTQPAEMILVQAVLPEANPLPASFVAAGATDTVPTEKPSTATPFVFTPYSLFSKAQMMLLRGRQADDFEHQVVIEMRRRYPSSLQQESDEKSPMGSRRASITTGSKGLTDYTGSEEGDSDEKDLVTPHPGDASALSKTTAAAAQLPNVVKQWAGALTSNLDRRNSLRNQAATGEKDENSRSRRGSVLSSTSRLIAASPPSTTADHEMRSVAILNSDTLPPSSMPSPSSAIIPLAREDSRGANSSLGIRRFTQGQSAPGMPAAPSPVPSASQRFATPNDESAAVVAAGRSSVKHRSAETSSPAPTGSLSERPVAPPRVSSAQTQNLTFSDVAPAPRVGRAASQRPSTAPQGGLTSPLPLSSPRGTARPRTAESTHSTTRVVSQRHAARSGATGGNVNEASLMARLRSDDWSTRQLKALERGPMGTGLLGVDF